MTTRNNCFDSNTKATEGCETCDSRVLCPVFGFRSWLIDHLTKKFPPVLPHSTIDYIYDTAYNAFSILPDGRVILTNEDMSKLLILVFHLGYFVGLPKPAPTSPSSALPMCICGMPMQFCICPTSK